MKAVTWHGRRDVRVEEVPDPALEGSRRRDHPDHLERTVRLGPAPLRDARPVHGRGRRPRPRADGHRRGGRHRSRRPAGRGPRGDPVPDLRAGTAGCATGGSHTQCETTQVREQGMGAALFGYSKLYGEVPGAQAEYLRVPQAHFMPIKVPEGPADDRFVFLSDVLPTAWQAVAYADVPDDGTLLVLGLGPIGDMATRIAAPPGSSGDRGRPRARAPGPRPRPRRPRHRPRRGRRRRRRGALAHRRPRRRRRRRRRRHGGARLAGGRARPAALQRRCRSGSPPPS